MCMMESTYAVANSIAGVSGSENVDNKKIITVPGTNIQSDETEEFDEILNGRSGMQEPVGRTA